MIKHSTASKLTWLAAILAASVALMTTADIANAKLDTNHGNNVQIKGAFPKFVISGQAANVKHVLGDHKDTKDKYAGKKKKDCGQIIVPTVECGVSTRDPVGNTHPGGTSAGNKTPGQTSIAGATKSPQFVISGQSTDKKYVVPGSSKTATILVNGQPTSAIDNSGGGLIVTLVGPDKIEITNSRHSSVTLQTSSVTLSGALSVEAGPGTVIQRYSNGDVTISIKPAEFVVDSNTLKQKGTDEITVSARYQIVRDHRNGQDPGVTVSQDKYGDTVIKAKNQSGVLDSIGNFIGNPFSVGSVPPANISTSVQQ